MSKNIGCITIALILSAVMAGCASTASTVSNSSLEKRAGWYETELNSWKERIASDPAHMLLHEALRGSKRLLVVDVVRPGGGGAAWLVAAWGFGDGSDLLLYGEEQGKIRFVELDDVQVEGFERLLEELPTVGFGKKQVTEHVWDGMSIFVRGVNGNVRTEACKGEISIDESARDEQWITRAVTLIDACAEKGTDAPFGNDK